MLRSLYVAATMAALSGVAGPGAVAQQATAVRAGPSFSRDLAIATFDSAWARIAATHYDTAFNGVDWNGVRAALRPAAAYAATLAELRSVIRDMLARLGESHYTLIPADVADAFDPGTDATAADGYPGDLGLDMRLVEGHLTVTRTEEGGPAAIAGVKPGWRVLAIDAFRPAEALERIGGLGSERERLNALTHFLWGSKAQADGGAGTVASVAFSDHADRTVELRVVRRRRPGQPVRMGELPTFFARLEHERIPAGPSCVGLIRLNVWMVPLMRAFDDAMDELRSCRGIVVDLRGNPGGVAGMVMGLSGHFLDERVTLGTMKSRGTELNFVANPRRVDTAARPVRPFGGPVAILVDGMSVSTSEIFAGGMQAIGRATIFGETTAGQALPAALYRLPDGDVLMHVVADFTAAGGTRIEGRGVIPDHPVRLDRSTLAAGRDAVLEAAIDWIVGGPAAGKRAPTGATHSHR